MKTVVHRVYHHLHMNLEKLLHSSSFVQRVFETQFHRFYCCDFFASEIVIYSSLVGNVHLNCEFQSIVSDFFIFIYRVQCIGCSENVAKRIFEFVSFAFKIHFLFLVNNMLPPPVLHASANTKKLLEFEIPHILAL